jgi:hypothetical protein
MFQLNPLGLADAWWQHSVMLLVAGIIGYIVGHRNGQVIIDDLQERLSWINIDLDKCRKTLTAATSSKPKIPEGKADDLKIIEGIGPQIERVLYKAGIRTFEQLSITSPEHIKDVLSEADPRFRVHNPGTWPRQANFAFQGKWKELYEWQQTLDGGVE